MIYRQFYSVFLNDVQKDVFFLYDGTRHGRLYTDVSIGKKESLTS